jgi:hypothetical protein
MASASLLASPSAQSQRAIENFRRDARQNSMLLTRAIGAGTLREKGGIRREWSCRMQRMRRRAGRRPLQFEQCEPRCVPTLVFVFNGNGYGAANPSPLTANAAEVLHAAGNQAVQLANPAITSPGVFDDLADEIGLLSHGQPIGIVGFSAGGALAERLAAIPTLHVTDVLACYSPPDLRDFFAYHGLDRFAAYVDDQIKANPAVIDLFSGRNPTTAHIVADFGLFDHAVEAAPSSASFAVDYPKGDAYYYDGGHGVSINASPPALADFLAHLRASGRALT